MLYSYIQRHADLGSAAFEPSHIEYEPKSARRCMYWYKAMKGRAMAVYKAFHGSRSKQLSSLSVRYSGTGIAGMNLFPVLWFTTSKENAEYYTDVQHEDEEIEEYIYKCEISMDNPYILTSEERSKMTCGMYDLAEDAYLKGHDGLIVKDIVDGTHYGDIYAVWDDDQIKSILQLAKAVSEA